jgi:hypothetical protein
MYVDFKIYEEPCNTIRANSAKCFIYLPSVPMAGRVPLFLTLVKPLKDKIYHTHESHDYSLPFGF